MPGTFHIFQPKHTLLKTEEAEKLLSKLNVSSTQLPKLKITDPAIPDNANIGDVVKVERKEGGKTHSYYRVIVA